MSESDHPTMKLGRLPAVNQPTLKLVDFLTSIPTHPIADPPPDIAWPMDLNDQVGDCVVAGIDHTLQVVHASLGVPYTNMNDAQLIDFYRTQNPGFNLNDPDHGPGSSDDGGMVVQWALTEAVRRGMLLGFAAVDPKNEEQVKAATYLGLGVVTGEDLQVAQQHQTTWDYVPGSPSWGGHCTTWVGYRGTPDTDVTVSWGKAVDMTQAFVSNRVGEAWFVITQAHVDHPNFRNHFDLQAFADAYSQITGKAFPVPVPPRPVPPPPAPVPPPPPPPAPPAPVPPPAPAPPAPVPPQPDPPQPTPPPPAPVPPTPNPTPPPAPDPVPPVPDPVPPAPAPPAPNPNVSGWDAFIQWLMDLLGRNQGKRP